jgi:hypothetical protein
MTLRIVVETLREVMVIIPPSRIKSHELQVNLIIIKHQRPHLNALPGRIILMRRIHKRCVRNPPRAPIVKRIVALDEQWFIGPLRVLEVPLVARVRLDRVRLALAVWVD